jgi:hypothetical protein
LSGAGLRSGLSGLAADEDSDDDAPPPLEDYM